MARKSVDLTTLSGWANLADGTHNISIVAKAAGYTDSAPSAGVTVTKGSQAYTDCLTFTGKTSEFTLKATYTEWNGTLMWSTDHVNWTTLTGTEAMQSVNKKLYLRGKGNTKIYTYNGVLWVLSEKADCTGNIQTLLDWENPPTSISENYCYYRMFSDCKNLTSAPELPATTLRRDCYGNMFYNCTSLTSAPELPATTLAYECYRSMFYGCTSLTSAPELPATTLAESCYAAMFSGCTSLTSAPELPVTTSKPGCYSYMFRDCTSLTSAPELPATTLAYECYYEMFRNCTSLTAAPKLPATTLAVGCYGNMFAGCTKLKVNTTSGNKIFTCPSTIPQSAVNNMFSGTGGAFTGTPTAGKTYYYTAGGAASVEYTVTINNGGSASIWVYQSDDESTQGDEVTGNNGVYVISKPYITLTTNGSMIEHISHSANIEELSGDSYKINGDGSISVNAICLTGDTLITLADGSQKRIDEITTADKVLSYNPDTMKLEADEIIYSDSTENKTHTEYDIYTLSDGTEIKTVHRHRFYNMERQAMVYMDEWNIGEHFIKIDGSSPTLVSHKKVIETVHHYTIFTKNQNYFANGVLSGNRYTKKMALGGQLNG